jgi:hypothetical protein
MHATCPVHLILLDSKQQPEGNPTVSCVCILSIGSTLVRAKCLIHDRGCLLKNTLFHYSFLERNFHPLWSQHNLMV